jgi:hypothetical protein
MRYIVALMTELRNILTHQKTHTFSIIPKKGIKKNLKIL